MRKLSLVVAVIILIAAVAGSVWAFNQSEEETKEEKEGEVASEKEKASENAEEVSYHIEEDKIILSWGEKPTGGYKIRIVDLEIKDGDLYVDYSLRSPDPDEMVTQAITYPKDEAESPGDFEEVHLNLIEEK